MSSFKSSENIQKKEGGPVKSVSDNQSSSEKKKNILPIFGVKLLKSASWGEHSLPLFTKLVSLMKVIIHFIYVIAKRLALDCHMHVEKTKS